MRVAPHRPARRRAVGGDPLRRRGPRRGRRGRSARGRVVRRAPAADRRRLFPAYDFAGQASVQRHLAARGHPRGGPVGASKRTPAGSAPRSWSWSGCPGARLRNDAPFLRKGWLADADRRGTGPAARQLARHPGAAPPASLGRSGGTTPGSTSCSGRPNGGPTPLAPRRPRCCRPHWRRGPPTWRGRARARCPPPSTTRLAWCRANLPAVGAYALGAVGRRAVREHGHRRGHGGSPPSWTSSWRRSGPPSSTWPGSWSCTR